MDEIIISPRRSVSSMNFYIKEGKKKRKKYNKMSIAKQKKHKRKVKKPTTLLKNIERIGMNVINAIVNYFKENKETVDKVCMSIITGCLAKVLV